MIHLQITKSPDPNVVTDFRFFFNQIYLGRSSGNLRINDPELIRSHVMLEVVEGELIIHPQREVTHYLINGKRATEIRKLRAKDSITIGSTTIQILAFEETQTPTKKQLLDKKMKELLVSDSPKLDIIEKLGALAK